MTFQSVRAIALRLPGVEEGLMYGAPAFKLGKRLIACIATNKSAEPDTLVLWTDFEQRDLLIAEQPDTYYLKDHYKGFPVVLVRLKRASPDALRDLLGAAHRLVSAGASKTAATPAPRDGPTSIREITALIFASDIAQRSNYHSDRWLHVAYQPCTWLLPPRRQCRRQWSSSTALPVSNCS